MKLSLAENIRSFRRQRKITQEKLAEALGVTVGAVYKWESGLSQPELSMLVELADFFDTSIDVLLGYQIKDNRLEAAGERILSLCKTLDPEALQEAEKLLVRYPHSFPAVYRCANVYLAFGAASHAPQLLQKSLELLERSRLLLSQNNDPRISEASICSDMAAAWFILGDHQKSIELLKQNNTDGLYSSSIGAILSIYGDDAEEAGDYLSKGLTAGISNLFNVILGYVFLFRSSRDWTKAMDILHWGIGILNGLKTEEKSNVLDQTYAELLILLAYAQEKAGMAAESEISLQKAKKAALRFDSMPDYSLHAMRFGNHTENALFFDIFGASASESIAALLGLLDEPSFTAKWQEAIQ